jgi:DUF1680 family protein
MVADYSEEEKYLQALENYLEKLETVITPAGGPIGDEWIAGRHADADETGYEYCSLQELLDSYSVLLEKSGDPKWADKIEWLLFNAAQGARHPEEPSIAYCKTDNSYHMLGTLDQELAGDKQTNRYKYSPTHQDVAVCCVPNAGRIYPYYVRSMWMREDEGLVANLFGPSVVRTNVLGTAVEITQDTRYPFEHTIVFRIEVEEPVFFRIGVRIPDWSAGTRSLSRAITSQDEDYFYFSNYWQDGDEIEVEFFSYPRVDEAPEGDRYISYGPLLFALELEAEPVVIKRYPLKKFRDVEYKATTDEKINYQWIQGSTPQPVRSRWHKKDPWTSISLSTIMYDPASGSEKKVDLVPMGGTILRKVSF